MLINSTTTGIQQAYYMKTLSKTTIARTFTVSSTFTVDS